MYLGLFGKTITGANIHDLTIVYTNVTATGTHSGDQWMGGLVASATGTTISNVHVSGNVNYTATNALNIGGLVGGAGSTTTQIENSSFTGILQGTGPGYVSAGGIVGALNGSLNTATIKASYAAGKINAASSSSDAYAGGIAGDGKYAITNCYSTANVTAASAINNAYAGGIIGNLSGSGTRVQKCYAALGTVAATGGSTQRAGGIAGYIDSSAFIEYCVTLLQRVEVFSGFFAGKIAGNSSGTYMSNYGAFDTIISAGGGTPTGINGDETYSIAQLSGASNESKYTDPPTAGLGWTFPATWKWLPGSGYNYPVLFWQTSPPAAPVP
jgi:hypothetical protein